MRKNSIVLALLLTLILSGCSSKPKGPTYSNPFGLGITSLRVIVANSSAYTSESNKHYVIGPLYVESNDLERKMLTIRPLTETEEIDMDVEIEVSYRYLGDSAEFIKTTKGDVVYARGFMTQYYQSNNYCFYAEVMKPAIVNQ